MVFEKGLIRICINGMLTPYRIHIENHVITNFADLMFRVNNTEASMSQMYVPTPVQTTPSQGATSVTPYKRKRMIAMIDQHLNFVLH